MFTDDTIRRFEVVVDFDLVPNAYNGFLDVDSFVTDIEESIFRVIFPIQRRNFFNYILVIIFWTNGNR